MRSGHVRTLLPMRAKTLQIIWHDKQPVLSVDMDPQCHWRFATAGGDNDVRIWSLTNGNIEYRSSLSRHVSAVNCVRFSPDGRYLASGGDGIPSSTNPDGTILIWEQTDKKQTALGDTAEDCLEHWRTAMVLRYPLSNQSGTTSDIYDLAWSPNGNFLASAGIDASTRIYDIKERTVFPNIEKCLHVLTDHVHFIQGVAWDPMFEYLATQSSDRFFTFTYERTVHVYRYDEKGWKTIPKLLTRHSKMPRVSKLASQVEGSEQTEIANEETTQNTMIVDSEPVPEVIKLESDPSTPDVMVIESSSTPSPPQTNGITEIQNPAIPSTEATIPKQSKSYRMYEDEDLNSFFRRLTFSPDGSVLVTPAGLSSHSENNHASYMFLRSDLHRSPYVCLGGHKRAVIAIRFNPIKYVLKPTESTPVLDKPYRYIYAVATQDSVVLYDTQHTFPIGYIGNLHYATLTDVCWSCDGSVLVMSSTDGFCSVVEFGGDELGVVYEGGMEGDVVMESGVGMESVVGMSEVYCRPEIEGDVCVDVVDVDDVVCEEGSKDVEVIDLETAVEASGPDSGVAPVFVLIPRKKVIVPVASSATDATETSLGDSITEEKSDLDTTADSLTTPSLIDTSQTPNIAEPAAIPGEESVDEDGASDAEQDDSDEGEFVADDDVIDEDLSAQTVSDEHFVAASVAIAAKNKVRDGDLKDLPAKKRIKPTFLGTGL